MSSHFQMGALLEGRFRLVSSLGEGSMGAVWLAKDHKLGIDVAVKVMQSQMRLDPGRRAAFEREAELCARMLSPHIVRVLSYGIMTAGDAPYIIYEALEGEALDRRIYKHGKLSLDETEEVVVHVARALARAHSMGVVHKDIKPGNVFLTKDDRGRMLAKVLDFGIAEIVQPHPTAVGMITGTPEYMPLEVFRGAPPDARADLFALAVLAYECLSGAVPYVGESVMDVIDALSGAPPSLTRTFSEEAAYPLDAWMHRGLAPDAGLRFQSARDLAETFHDAIKQAKGALGLIPSASARKAAQPSDRVVPANSVDTVMQAPVRPPPVPPSGGPKPPRPPQAPPSKPLAVPRPPASKPVVSSPPASGPGRHASTPIRPGAPSPSALAKMAANLPPMRPRSESFVFDEEFPARPSQKTGVAQELVDANHIADKRRE
jgi:serine/threonine-protein kinase